MRVVTDGKLATVAKMSSHVIGFATLSTLRGINVRKNHRNHRVGAIALLPFFLFAFPHFAAAQADGQKVFDTNCAKCHGPDGTGNTVVGKAVGAKDLGSAEAKKLTDPEIRTQIDQGKREYASFRRNPEQSADRQFDSDRPRVWEETSGC